MLKKVKRLIKSLCRESGGNVMMIFALGMPVFVGGAGLAVDTAQWYMWKREMQYAVDQAALAGAWSRVGGSTGDIYQTRAQQELAANLQIVDFQGTPAISLANYEGGTNNSVLVTLSASKALPFSSMLMGHGATIAVRAQAAFEKGRTFTACLIAVDPTTSGAITIGGSAYVVANCGAAALSTNADAVIRNGSPVFDVGYIVASGGIDDEFDGDPNLQVYENQTGLVDPFAELVPPDNPTPRTYGCEPATTKYIATYSDTKTVEEWTYSGKNRNNLPLVSKRVLSSGTEPALTREVTRQAAVGDVIIDTHTTTATGTVTSSGGNFNRVDTVKTQKAVINAIEEKVTEGGANPDPGTYATFVIGCNTVMKKGVYVIDGGLFRINANYNLVGQGVMIVLKNGAGIEINGNSNLDLRAMDFDEMRAAGISAEQALKLKDMLIFEDRNSSGYAGNSVNGTAGAILDGTVYLPKSPIRFNGTFSVVKRCLVITAKTITIEGNANMTSFCPTGVNNTVSVGGGVTSVRLVA
ncbi:MAG: pilus assembly protein [Novosphingobium sp.]|nr:pilus assembly protein [Novosphingobium sp.]